MLSRKRLVVAVVALLFFLMVYLPLNGRHSSNVIVIAPSYVLAIKGNDLPLYGEVLEEREEIRLTTYSREKSQKYIWNSTDLATRNSNTYLNLHIWYDICEDSLENLLFYPLFPEYPTTKTQVNEFSVNKVRENTGMRLFGYIVPLKSSKYTFQLTLKSIIVQVWLSTSSSTKESIPLFESDSINLPTRLTSHEIDLIKDEKYFIDIVFKTGSSVGSFNMLWNEKSWATPVAIKCVQPYLKEAHLPAQTINLDVKSPTDTPMLSGKKKFHDLDDTRNSKRSQMFLVPFIDEKDVKNLLPSCPYQPLYTPKIVKGFQGVWETHLIATYPDDNTDIPYKLEGSGSRMHTIFGNPTVQSDVAENVVNQVMKALKLKFGEKYSLVEVLNIEENIIDPESGARYLVELELSLNSTPSTVRFSEYVYKPKNSKTLCSPENFTWNKNAYVNILLSAGKQGRWIKYYIDTFSRIYDETHDKNFNVIIVDFDSKDIDISRALSESSIPNYALLKHSGKFHRTSMQSGANIVKDENAIILTMDLHLVIPSNFIDSVRKHTIIGKTAFAPLLARLQCGASPQKMYGFWEISGYGIFSLYKKDFTRIGGMNIEKFKDKWGDEDWDMLDRTFQNLLEVERKKIRNFFHLYHSRKGLW